jgi:hypothetical protein
MRVTIEQRDRLQIRSGPVQIHVAGTQEAPPEEPETGGEAAPAEQKEAQ